jgi:hypothetical protein
VSVDNIVAVSGQVEETAEEQTTVQEIFEKIEGKALKHYLGSPKQPLKYQATKHEVLSKQFKWELLLMLQEHKLRLKDNL